MKFDVYIGNPPYQGGNRSIYPLFISLAPYLGVKHACLIVNNNWIKGDTHRETRKILMENGLQTIVNFGTPGKIFPGVHVAVCIIQFSPSKRHLGQFKVTSGTEEYTLSTNSDYIIDFPINNRRGKDESSMLEHEASILKKVTDREYCNSWDLAKNARLWSIASNGFHMYSNYTEDIYNWYSEEELDRLGIDNSKFVKVAFLNAAKQLYFRYTTIDSLIRGREAVELYKVVCGSKAQTTKNVISNIHILQPGEICTNSFGIIGLAETKEEAEFIFKYANTKFFRYLVSKAISGLKVSFGNGCTKYVPLISERERKDIQDLSIKELDVYFYKKYDFSLADINVIESAVN